MPPPIPGSRPQHARHTRAQPNTGLPNNQLNPPIAPRRRRRYRIRYRLRPGWRLGRLALMLWPVSPIHTHLFRAIDRTGYADLRRLNSLLGNPPWPMWNAFQDHTNVAWPFPVDEIPVACEDCPVLLRIPKRSTHIHSNLWHAWHAGIRQTLLDWDTVQGPREQCTHNESHIRTHGIQFYRCITKAQFVDHSDPNAPNHPNHPNTTLLDARNGYARILANPPIFPVRPLQFLPNPPGHHWVCSECARKAALHYDWTLWEPNRIWLHCRHCSLAARQHPIHWCDCKERFSVERFPGGKNRLCSHCRWILSEAAKDQMINNCVRYMRRGWHRHHGPIPVGPNPIDDSLALNRNNCTIACRRNYIRIIRSYCGGPITPTVAPIQLDRKWRQCTVCVGLIPETASGEVPIAVQMNCL